MFPVDISLDEVRKVIAAHNMSLGSPVFIEADRDPFVIFNYVISVPGAFPAWTGDAQRDREIGIIRECRGLTFDKATGKIVARKFAKFHNLNERPDTQASAIDWSRPHVIMAKLDGSMITPVPNGAAIEWHTKMGATDVAKPVAEFVAKHPDYTAFARLCLFAGYTPIFEWCSRQQRIVIDYPTEALVLTHLRSLRTGAYAPRETLGELLVEYPDIPLVKTIRGPITDIDAFIVQTRALKGEEGYVIQFTDTGEMVKLKADEYCLIHSTKETLTLEKNVLALVLSEALDDSLAMMSPEDRAAVAAYAASVEEAILATANEATMLARDLMLALPVTYDLKATKKAYAERVMTAAAGYPHAFMQRLLFAAYDDKDLYAEVRRLVAANCSTGTAVETVRPLLRGINWNDYRYGATDEQA